MSTWTWTFVKTSCLTKEMKKKLLDYAIWQTNGIVYYDDYVKNGWNYALNKWLERHKEDYDYYITECGVPKEHMTDEYLIKELKKNIRNIDGQKALYQKVLDDEISFDEMLSSIAKKKLGRIDDRFYIIKRNGNDYVNLGGEWWRNQIHSENEFCTVDGLINWLKEPGHALITDFTSDNKERINYLSEEMEEKLRKWYGDIGDNNFYVHFG